MPSTFDMNKRIKADGFSPVDTDKIFTRGISRPAKLADQLYEEILQQIVSAKLSEGKRLPSESHMAEVYGVSRPVVREALSRLRADGMIVSRHGSGSYVQRKPSKALLSLAPIGGIADLMRCYEFRIALEGEAASLAAMRRTNEDLKAIADAFQAMARAVQSGEVGAEADIRFHNAIAAATKNKVFESAMEALAVHTLQGITVTRNLSLRVGRKRLETVQAEHKLIYDAIRESNPDGARDAMRSHIDNARNRILTESVEPQDYRPETLNQ